MLFSLFRFCVFHRRPAGIVLGATDRLGGADTHIVSGLGFQRFDGGRSGLVTADIHRLHALKRFGGGIMKHCRECNIDIDTNRVTCPFCRDILDEKNNEKTEKS